ncbi:hypothetical protein L1887_10360 [Cichorium endivia]|nr:hypothetical protein L1887_10360 [Cichorium endivia]
MEGTFSVKSDVFSFGVLTFEIVSGRRNTSFSYLDKTAWELWLQGDALELRGSNTSRYKKMYQIEDFGVLNMTQCYYLFQSSRHSIVADLSRSQLLPKES